ncbi:MAG: helix-turn-helix transcriptional regulator [Alphaproteobacteria bacterium]|nr:helix-turn-helix transcriptional regulator [Alphaproteobacteria bacterium]
MAKVRVKAKDDIAVERGSGNVFADLGLHSAESHLIKAELVSRLVRIIRECRLTQTQAGEIMGISQPDVSRLVRGDFREYSVERLLLALGRDVEIVIREAKSGRGRLTVAA